MAASAQSWADHLATNNCALVHEQQQTYGENLAVGTNLTPQQAVDLWAGGLAEDHSPGAVIGPTFGRIIADQFTALRDGDRYYFENQNFDRQTLSEIKNTTCRT